MKKKLLFSLLVLTVLGLTIAALVLTKGSQFAAMAAAGENGGPPPSTVTVRPVETQTWKTRLKAVGSVEPIRGILVETEAAGVVETIGFENGRMVQKDDLLVQLKIDVERAQRRAAKATAALAETEFRRAEQLRASGSIPQSRLDEATADLERARAEVENIEAMIDRKTIKAPFTGRAGIRQVNLGQFVPLGAPIVNLQSDAQVYVNFSLPQRHLKALREGLTIEVGSDAFPGERFRGKLTAISPEVSNMTRNINLQGTLDNPRGLLRSGLFVEVDVVLPEEETVTIVPATAIQYAPYGNSVFIVEAPSDPQAEGASLTVDQRFVRLGRTRGDFVSVVKGLEPGQRVVTVGGFKLKNGDRIRIDNEQAPEAKLRPSPDNA